MNPFTLRRSPVFMLITLILLIVGVFFTSAKATPSTATEPASGADPLIYLPNLYTTPLEHPSAINFVPFATGLPGKSINAITHAHDNRLFVVEREGYIRIIFPNGSVHPTPFLDIHTLVGTTNWEEGMLGLVFHPNYPAVPHFYITYTDKTSKTIFLDRLSVSADPNAANPASRVTLLTIAKPLDGETPSPVHNGGDLHFGPDGYLYMSVGDGGPDPWVGSGIPGDPDNNSQDILSLLGKILRLDVNQSTGIPPECGGSYYTIPPDNPYVNRGGCDEVWAIGLRNPWRFSFDRLTGDMFIGDVGEWQREELNIQPAGLPGGRNYGWHCWEGTFNYSIAFPQVMSDCQYDEPQLYTPPAFEYGHNTGGCSIVAGYMYRGNQSYSFYGDYIFADFCTGYWLAHQNESGAWVFQEMGDVTFFISTFGEGFNGELYAGAWLPSGNSNTVYKLVPVGG